VIRRYARAIAERFQPDKIILFGSYAYGTPNEDSDVDLLVVMPARYTGGKVYKIRLAFSAPFEMDLIVRTPEDLRRRLEDGDLFHTEIVTRGKVLYEKGAGSRRCGRSAARCSTFG
jgi:predicted nucleotidyltransferase